MKPSGSIKLVAALRDLQIVDRDGCNCGIVDDVELEGRPGGPLKVAALLVGPGAYAARLPGWAMRLVGWIGGREAVNVPWTRVESITSVVHLNVTAAQAGLGKGEGRALRWLPGGGR
ncbi:MAG: PRC-barrel domain-containing protein [Allosphingosinicella sp.]